MAGCISLGMLPSLRAAVRNPHWPKFSWGTVPVFAHCGKGDGPFTDEEASALARFALVNLEKIQEAKLRKPAFESMRTAALAIKKQKPTTRVAVYWNTCIEDCARLHGEGYDEYVANRHEWQMIDKNGKPVRVGNLGLFDMTCPAVQRWWLERVRKLAQEPAYDGIFLDASGRGHWLISQCGQERADAFDDSMQYVLSELRAMTGKFLVFNGLNVKIPHWTDAGTRHLKHTDGMMVEHFLGRSQREADGSLRIADVGKTFDRIRDVSRSGKLILVRSWPRTHAFWGLQPGELSPENAARKKAGRPLPADAAPPADKLRQILKSDLSFCLGCFLICAGENCYFNYSWGYGTNGPLASGNFEWYPEFDRRLGPPKGDFRRTGMSYTREFAHAAVRVDLENEQAYIDWG